MWSIATAAGSVGTTVGGPILLYFIEDGNWRGAFLFAGISSLIVSIILYMTLTDKPEHQESEPEKNKVNSPKKKEEQRKDTLSSFFQIVARRFVSL